MKDLPNISEVKKNVENWEEAIWKELYKNVDSLDEKLAIISEKLKLNSMPFLKSQLEKLDYLMELEDDYYDEIFRSCHDYGL